MTPDQFQSVALSWIGALTVVITAATAAVVRNWKSLDQAAEVIAELRRRIEKHEEVLNER